MMKDEKLQIYPCRSSNGQNMENSHCKRHCSLKENCLMCDPVGYKEVVFEWGYVVSGVEIAIGLGAIYLIWKYLI